METFSQSLDIGDVLGEGFDLDFGLQALPIGEAQGDALIIVENGYPHYENASHRIDLANIVSLRRGGCKESPGLVLQRRVVDRPCFNAVFTVPSLDWITLPE
jgi:hypothetical protein